MKLEFTHYWVTGFGWENTIFLSSDFCEVEEFGRDGDIIIFIGINESGCKHILKGKYV